MRSLLRPRILIGAGLASALVLAIVIIVSAMAHPTRGEQSATVPVAAQVVGDSDIVRVSTIAPKKDPHFTVSIQQLTGIRAYFQVDLKTRVAGVVRTVKTDLGALVKKGDVLLEIDVPDLDQEVLQKKAIVEQRREETRMAVAKVKSSQAFVDVARASIDQQKAGVLQAAATRDYRKKRLDRFRELYKRQAINEDIVDEQEKDWQGGEAAFEIARASVDKATADLKEKEASRETALVDVDLKKALITVAQHDLERSQALADYAKIVAPFDGVITKRNVNPGHFVQNSSTSSTEPLLSLARIDIVTAVAKVPDNAAAFISTNTPVEIQVDQLPGANLSAKITRFSPSIDPSDRTMHVEVDLLNSNEVCKTDLRNGTEACCFANPVGEVLGSRRLLPGMNGYMRLKLNEFAHACLVPSNAIFSRGGKQYVILVEQGRTKLCPVVVQVNDGKLAKIALLQRNEAGREVTVELTGREEIVASRQSELDDGQQIQANRQDW